VPLASVAGRIAGFPENLGERDRVARQRPAVGEHGVILRVSARDECGPAGRADRRGGVESRRDGSVVGEPVDVRRFADGGAPHQRTVLGHELAVAAQRAEIMLVGVDDNQVRLVRLRGHGRRCERRRQSEAGENAAYSILRDCTLSHFNLLIQKTIDPNALLHRL